MRTHPFGELPDGRPVTRIVLGSAPGPELHLLDLGATAHRLEVTGPDGVRRNVLLGHATPGEYLDSTNFIGGTIGRYANRIAAGRFPLEGREVQVGTPDRGNHLHGGPDGFHRRLWTVLERSDDSVTLELHSPDGDQGFPGALTARATYAVTADGVDITLTATSDDVTVANLTSHAYFHLDGEGAGVIDEQLLEIRAEHYTPVDATGIPTGDHAPVAGTPFDLRTARPIGPTVREAHPQLLDARGIDHNYVIDGVGLRTHAVVTSATSGLRLEVRSDQPGLQVYTGNFLDGSALDATGRMLRQGDGLALEPQLFPDSPNRPDFPSATLRPGETYRSTIQWRITPA